MENNKKKPQNQFQFRFTNIDTMNTIRNLAHEKKLTINFIMNESLKYGLPLFIKSLNNTTEEGINPAETKNMQAVSKRLDKLLEFQEIMDEQLNDILEKQAILGANLELCKYITSSIYSRQKVRDVENANLRAFSEAEENAFDTRVPKQFLDKYNAFIKDLFEEGEEDDEE